jgi:hypothetical protein
MLVVFVVGADFSVIEPLVIAVGAGTPVINALVIRVVDDTAAEEALGLTSSSMSRTLSQWPRSAVRLESPGES